MFEFFVFHFYPRLNGRALRASQAERTPVEKLASIFNLKIRFVLHKMMHAAHFFASGNVDHFLFI